MNVKSPVVKDIAITGVLALAALVAVLAAGNVLDTATPGSNLERQARKDDIAFIKQQTILSHSEELAPSGVVIVRYTYLGERLPEKLAEDEVLALRTASSWTRQVGVEKDGRAIYEVKAFPSPQYTQYLGQWYHLEYGAAPKEVFEASQRSFFSFLSFPIAHAIALTQYGHFGDGEVANASTTWALTRGATSAVYGLSSGANYFQQSMSVRSMHHTNAGKLDGLSTGYYIHRAFLPFDTSSIPFGASISAASLNAYATGTPTNTDNDGADFVTVVQTSQAAEFYVLSEDFDQSGGTEGIDAGQRKDITSITPNAYMTFTLNSTGRSWIKTNGQTNSCGSSGPIFINLTGTTTWRVPNDWDASNNSIEVIGAGGGGRSGTTTAANGGGAGGGGGAYSKVTNVSLPLGQEVSIVIGNGSQDVDGGDTFVCNSTSNCDSIAGSAVVVGAKGGKAGTEPGAGTAQGGGGQGGQASAGVGTTKYSGGNGGDRNVGAGGGGGGSGGPNGNGGNGGAGGTTAPRGGGGGGGSGGGTAGAQGTSSGGAGGNNYLGAGSGAGGGAGATGAEGTAGGGGGGGGGSASGAAGSAGGAGAGTEWDSQHGVVGGGGGGGQSTAASGAHGNGGSGGFAPIFATLHYIYAGGGSGGGAGSNNGGAAGYSGIPGPGAVIIQYSNAGKGTTCLGLREGHDFTNASIDVDKDNNVGIAASENAGTSADPYLSVTYTAPFAFWQFFDF